LSHVFKTIEGHLDYSTKKWQTSLVVLCR